MQVPCGAAGYYLLGRISRLTGRITDAKEQFVKALRLNPLLWSAYEELCAIGKALRPEPMAASLVRDCGDTQQLWLKIND
jgi:tetratricopeptide (TPR) repeat protein